MSYWLSVLIAIDQLFNAVLWGWPDETLSSRAYQSYILADRPKWRWFLMFHIINGLFFDSEHCKSSYLSERDRKHSYIQPESAVNPNGPVGAKPQV